MTEGYLKHQLLYRCIPTDKEYFLALLRLHKKCCLYSGDSVSDSVPLKIANVGISMGQSGCPASKSSADIIILDDNFRSVKDAVKWGRNIFDNARKVVQF